MMNNTKHAKNTTMTKYIVQNREILFQNSQQWIIIGLKMYSDITK